MLTFPAWRRGQPARHGARGAGLVELRGVSVAVQRTPVLRELDWDMATGEAVGVLGANGSGKSTLLSVLATLRTPCAGSARVLGAQLGTGECAAVRPWIALVGHTPALYPQLTLAENLRFFASLLGRSDRASDAALEAVGLTGARRRRAGECSQGMRRRADLARAMLVQPRLLLLDEVHAGLDAASVGLVDEMIRQVCRRAGGAVVVSHEQRLVSVTDRVVEIVHGRALRRADQEGTR